MFYLIIIVALGILGMNRVKGSRILMNKELRMGLLLMLDFSFLISYTTSVLLPFVSIGYVYVYVLCLNDLFLVMVFGFL